MDGTTDITRTVHFGKPSAHEKACYTAVLKGHIALDTVVFPNGCRDVFASFDKYVEVERLEGNNKYHAYQYGLQHAKKGVLFTDFPPVL